MPTGNIRIPKAVWPAGQKTLAANVRDGSGRAMSQANFGKQVIFNAPGGGVAPPDQLAVRADINEVPNGNPLDGANWVITVQAGQPSDNSIHSPFWAAKVKYGTGGIFSDIIVTATPGFSLSVPGDSCEVYIGQNPGSNVIGAVTEQSFNVTLKRSSTEAQGRVRLLQQCNDGSLVFVPKYAVALLPTSPNAYGAGVTAAFSNGFTYTAAEFTAIKGNGGYAHVPSGMATLAWAGNPGQQYTFDWLLEL